MRKPQAVLLCLVLLLSWLAGVPALAQDDDDQPESDTTLNLPDEALPIDTSLNLPDDALWSDTLLYSPDDALEGYLAVSNPINTELRLTQNPTKAIFKSMLIPGWGQIGNRKYRKAVIYASMQVSWIVLALDYRSQADDFYEQYLTADSMNTKNHFYSLYEEKKNKRNRYYWFAGITTFISMFDAYVDAHLSGFPIVENLKPVELSVGPTRQYDIGASLSYRF
jgi:hypothetical protein